MNEQLKQKIDAQRERIQSERVAISKLADKQERDRRTGVIQDEEKALFDSLTENERAVLEQRLKELERVAGFPTQPRSLDPSNPKVLDVPWQDHDEYYFLRRLLTGV